MGVFTLGKTDNTTDQELVIILTLKGEGENLNDD